MADLTREQQIRMWHRPAPHWPADCWCEECRPDSWRNIRGREMETEVESLRSSLRAAEAETARLRRLLRCDHTDGCAALTADVPCDCPWDACVHRTEAAEAERDRVAGVYESERLSRAADRATLRAECEKYIAMIGEVSDRLRVAEEKYQVVIDAAADRTRARLAAEDRLRAAEERAEAAEFATEGWENTARLNERKGAEWMQRAEAAERRAEGLEEALRSLVSITDDTGIPVSVVEAARRFATARAALARPRSEDE